MNICSRRHLCTNVYHSLIRNSHKLERIQVSISQLMNQPRVVHSHRGPRFSNKKGQTDACDDRNESPNHYDK